MASQAAAGPALAETASGRVRGEVLGDLRVWRGIPYAAAPTGAQRFRPPQPATRWDGIRPAVDRGPVAWQSERVNPFTGQLETLDRDEDCLIVNITAPARPAAGAAYPVLVWVHGGGYVQGRGADALVGDGAGLARSGLVVVTFNYRLGSLGFLHLGDEAGPEYAAAGQAGFLDQVAALRWVQANIAGFGGDPARVCLYGVSAGAKSIANLLSSPLTAGLSSRAISASGGGEHVATPAQAAPVRRLFFRELGLGRGGDGGRRLRDLPAEELVAAQEAIAPEAAGTWVWRPVLGGPGLPVLPVQAVAGGAAAGIPLLIGSNGNEAATYQLMNSTAAEQAPRVLAELFGTADAAAMLAAYAAARPELDELGIRLAIMTAERYGIPTQRLAVAQAAHAPVWRYRFDGCPAGMPAELAGGHGLDMFAVWAADQLAAAGADDPQARLCQSMAGAWVRFAHGKLPGDDWLPDWPDFDAAAESTMILGPQPHVTRHPRAAEFAIWQGRNWPSGTWWQPNGLTE
jgi:para-nitrobenzyl esterase